MKKIFSCLFIGITLIFGCVSCQSKEEKAVIAELSSTLKSPSSLKIIEIEFSKCPEIVTYDTMYHIGTIFGEKWFEDSEDFRTIDSIFIDSIKIATTIYPEHHEYTITYDADNSYGAAIRNKATYCVDDNGILPIMDWNSIQWDKKTPFICSAYQLSAKCMMNGSNLYSYHTNNWIYDFRLKEFMGME